MRNFNQQCDVSLSAFASKNTFCKQGLRGLAMVSGLLSCAGNAEQRPFPPVASTAVNANAPSEASRMWMITGGHRFIFTVANNATGRAFAKMLPLKLEMAELNGNEKHAELAAELPTAIVRPGTIRNGDLFLYGSRTLVLFYKDFRSSYAYTAVGRAADPAGVARALGNGDVRVEFVASE